MIYTTISAISFKGSGGYLSNRLILKNRQLMGNNEGFHEWPCRTGIPIGVRLKYSGVPPAECRVGRPLIQKGKWAPCGFFRLFCTCRTCTPKPVSAPLKKVLVQSTTSNHEHGRGISPELLPSNAHFFRLQKRPVTIQHENEGLFQGMFPGAKCDAPSSVAMRLK